MWSVLVLVLVAWGGGGVAVVDGGGYWVWFLGLFVFGFGFGVGEVGCFSFMMCNSHVSLSSVMWSQWSRFPLRIGDVVVVCLPVIFDVLVIVLDICKGSRVCRLCGRGGLFCL